MSRDKIKSFFKKIGVFGFIFFLVKGPLWLVAPTLITLFSLK